MIVHRRVDTTVPESTWLGLGKVAPASIGHYLVNGLIDGGIRALVPGTRMLGRAATLRQPFPDAIPLHVAFDHLQAGDVLVIDRAGDCRTGCLGEMTVRMGLARGLAGFVVDGTVTDIVELGELGLPVYARGTTVAATKPLNAPGAELFGAVHVGGCVVRTGDIVLGDENGVLVIDPHDERLAEFVAEALAYEAKEVEWRREIAAGKLLADLSGARAMIKAAIDGGP